MTDKPVDYRLTDKWPEGWRGLTLHKSSEKCDDPDETLYYLPFTQHGWCGNDLTVSLTYIKSNPDLFEKVEEGKHSNHLQLIECAHCIEMVETLKKKAGAGEEFADKIGNILTDNENQHPIFLRCLYALEKYREAVNGISPKT